MVVPLLRSYWSSIPCTHSARAALLHILDKASAFQVQVGDESKVQVSQATDTRVAAVQELCLFFFCSGCLLRKQQLMCPVGQ